MEVNFLKVCMHFLNQFGEEPYILGGDMITVKDPHVDRCPNNNQYHPNCFTRIETLKEDFDLVDIWPFMNQCKLQYTWRSNTFQSRIDYLLISKYFQKNSIVHTDIHYGYRSDHSTISLSIEQSVPRRCPGFWKLNTSLLLSLPNRSEIHKSIRSVIEEI